MRRPVIRRECSACKHKEGARAVDARRERQNKIVRVARHRARQSARGKPGSMPNLGASPALPTHIDSEARRAPPSAININKQPAPGRLATANGYNHPCRGGPAGPIRRLKPKETASEANRSKARAYRSHPQAIKPNRAIKKQNHHQRQ